MGELKLKINLGGAYIELEGEGSLVKEILDDLKTDGLGALASNSLPTQQPIDAKKQDINDINATKEETKEELPNEEYPPLQDILISGYAKTGQEKLLVFAFYSSDYGTKPISTEDIKGLGAQNNYSIAKNFTYYLNALRKDRYISSYNSDSYTLTQKGKEQAQNIILNKETEKTTKKQKTPKTPPKYNLIEMNFIPDEKKDLLDVFSKNSSLSKIDTVLLACDWLSKNRQTKIVTQDTIFTILKTANASTNFKIPDALGNAKKKNYFSSTQTKGEFELNHIGEEYISKNLMPQG